MNKNTDKHLNELLELASKFQNTATRTASSQLIVHGTRLTRKENKTILYLCDGAVEACPKTSCYKRGHECRHTTDITHALNPEPRNFVPDEQGTLWEVEGEPSAIVCLCSRIVRERASVYFIRRRFTGCRSASRKSLPQNSCKNVMASPPLPLE